MCLDALAVDAFDMTAVTDGLPAPAGEAGWLNLIVAATPCAAPMFADAVKKVTVTQQRDVLLVRTGLWPELLDPVTAEVGLWCNGEAVLLDELLFFRHLDGSLWLVPEAGRAAVSLSAAGLSLQLKMPFLDRDERSDGLARAAAEIKRRFLRQQVR